MKFGPLIMQFQQSGAKIRVFDTTQTSLHYFGSFIQCQHMNTLFKLARIISIKKYRAFPAFLWLSLQTAQTSGYEK